MMLQERWSVNGPRSVEKNTAMPQGHNRVEANQYNDRRTKETGTVQITVICCENPSKNLQQRQIRSYWGRYQIY